MIGFQLLLQGMQNGGTLPSTMSLPWLVLVFLVSHMPCLSLDGISLKPKLHFAFFLLKIV